MSRHPNSPTASSAPATPSFRSSAVARLAGMPVSTLRIWEQRYQAVGPSTSSTGHRLYSTADVERVMLLRQLTAHGHAIGSLATLDTEQLLKLPLTQPEPESPGALAAPLRQTPLRVVVVGQALALRLQRPVVFRDFAHLPQVVAVFNSLGDAAKASPTTAHVDVLLWQAAGLQEGMMPELKAAQAAWKPAIVAVAYRFAGASARGALADAGAVLTREPADDETLGAWLCSLNAALGGEQARPARGPAMGGASTGATDHPWLPDALAFGGRAAPVRRFNDATLTEFAGLSSGIACECPSHVAELLIQIASFEAYSADCKNRSPADAELHAYLHRVAGAARVLFEAALERVAVTEGWALPRTLQSDSRGTSP